MNRSASATVPAQADPGERGEAAPASRAGRRTAVVCVALGALMLVACGLRLGIGTTGLGLPPSDVWFVWQARVMLMALGLVVGMNLAVSGVALQALLRNPLAEPFILGLSTGAAAGMMAQRWLWFQLGWGVGVDHAGALIGAVVVISIVFLASRREGLIDPLGLLLTGVVISTIGGAVVMFFNYSIGQGGLREGVARWMMGYLNAADTSWGTLVFVASMGLAGLGLLLWLGRAMDLATLSDEEAQSLGVNLKRLRVVLLLVASFLAAGAVILSGPIAFVGLVCPHLARLMIGPSHRPLLIASALLGATLIVLADTLTAGIDLALGIGSLPIGIFTAVVGGVAFLWMLRPRVGQGGW